MSRVVIIGAGIGGLVLAQGLRAAGVGVSVHERDTDLARTGGYRLHLDPGALAALRRRLPVAIYQALVASAAPAASFRQFALLDHRLRTLARIPRGGDGEHVLIGRIPLRLLLGHGLAGTLVPGSTFEALEHNADGTVTATFADGTSETADVLVGADGARSRVAAALAGHPTARPLPSSGLAGRAGLTPELGTGLPADLSAGPAFVLGPDGTVVFLSLHDATTAAIAPDACGDVPARIEAPYVVWGIVDPAPVIGAGLTGVDALAVARTRLRGWAGWLTGLLEASDLGTVAQFPYYAADPGAGLTPWPARAATALGDAVHAVPPTGGQGAATAIRDADLLATHLLGSPGFAAVPLALHDFQQGMAAYAPAVIRASVAPLHWQRRLTSRAGRPLLRALLPVAGAAAGAVAAMRRRAPDGGPQ
ncbi:NAD(P)/FAD-dependent oxidoreductase [Amycolatopsis sp. PS_44_ISF1]|uniref:FAD-dependent oxidoreductase n=1 Tax=Amycolatopsis sp. PS_44_ISF1 TaxID=2974917 RepID=UPI0028DFBCB6|nr:NAD(P)/FAD-dependent oxidoreductase [Amycolatopsis sp. PS_44_ISF1]MDT8912427.1 FAD-dependent monooxygenase [Amycolatopsis sp. PS_44_ISF1]